MRAPAERRVVHLTKRFIDQAEYQPSKGNCIFWDDETKGFGLRLYPESKTKSFVVFYVARPSGRQRLGTIGRYGILTVDQARKEAIKVLAEVAQGGDPFGERKKLRQGDTIGDLCTRFLEASAGGKKSFRDYERRVKDYLLPAWRGLKVGSVTQQDVQRLHARITLTAPYEANRVLALISSIFNWGHAAGIIDPSVPNPAKGIKKNKEAKRSRFMDKAELQALIPEIEKEPNIYVRAALWLLLLTGARKSEILRARWENVDWNNGFIRLPDTKAGRPFNIALSSPAIEVLRQIPRVAGNPYILPGGKPGQALVNIKDPWGRIRGAAGLDGVRLHDIRRTMGSMLAQEGKSLLLIGKILNHSNVSTTQIYAHLTDQEPKQAVEGVGKSIAALAKPKLPDPRSHELPFGGGEGNV